MDLSKVSTQELLEELRERTSYDLIEDKDKREWLMENTVDIRCRWLYFSTAAVMHYSPEYVNKTPLTELQCLFSKRIKELRSDC